MIHRTTRNYTLLSLFALLCALTAPAWAVDIFDTQPIGLDIPRVNAVFLPVGSDTPYNDGEGGFNAFGYIDTGSSGIVLDSATADLIGFPRDPGVQFGDIGVGGSTLFDVSQGVQLRLAPWNSPNADQQNLIPTVYNQAYSPVRVQVGPTNVPSDPLDPLRVYGMPVLQGKTLVIDPKPLNDLSDFYIHPYIYDNGTPFNPAEADTNPGIPTTSHHVALSYASFDQFTTTTPAGAAPPSLAHNPFIGPSPLNQLNAQAGPQAHPLVSDPPPVSIDYNGFHTQGSLLLDSGAVVSMISSVLAENLHVRYTPGTFGSANPTLEIFDPSNPGTPGTLIDTQFTVPIQGIGGQVDLAGFFLDDLILRTIEGSALDSDPNNIRYRGAPVLVNDILVEDALGNFVLLDGILGTNFLVASASLDLAGGSTSPYNWITFDEPNGILGLDLVNVPEPGSLALAAVAAALLAAHAWRRRGISCRRRG